MTKKFRRMLDQPSGATTLIAADTVIEGSFSGGDNLVVCGRVTGNCDIPCCVTVAEGGSWIGKIKALHVVIAGKVEGEIMAERQIEVAASANIAGTLTGGSIAIAEGAVMDGDIRVSGGQAPRHFVEKRGETRTGEV